MHQVGDQTKVILRCTVNQSSRTHVIREREYVNEILGSVKSEEIPDKVSDD